MPLSREKVFNSNGQSSASAKTYYSNNVQCTTGNTP